MSYLVCHVQKFKASDVKEIIKKESTANAK